MCAETTYQDVGGGSVSNKTRNSLARIPLRWMVRECFKTGTGIMFNTEGLRKLGLDPSTLYPFVTPRPPALQPRSTLIETIPSVPLKERILARFKKQKRHGLEKPTEHVFSVGSEEEEELKDALSPAFDQLKLQRFWWILELFPLTLRYQRGDNKWVSYLGYVTRVNLVFPDLTWVRSVRILRAQGSFQSRAKMVSKSIGVFNSGWRRSAMEKSTRSIHPGPNFASSQLGLTD